MATLSVYLAGLITLIAGDLLWLGVLMRSFYAEKLGHLMAPTITWWAAGVFYLVYTWAAWWFVVVPAAGKGLPHIALQGFIFGACAYAVYDLTNQATLKNWPLQVTVIDILWGGLLTMAMVCIMATVTGWTTPRG